MDRYIEPTTGVEWGGGEGGGKRRAGVGWGGDKGGKERGLGDIVLGQHTLVLQSLAVKLETSD